MREDFIQKALRVGPILDRLGRFLTDYSSLIQDEIEEVQKDLQGQPGMNEATDSNLFQTPPLSRPQAPSFGINLDEARQPARPVQFDIPLINRTVENMAQ